MKQKTKHLERKIFYVSCEERGTTQGRGAKDLRSSNEGTDRNTVRNYEGILQSETAEGRTPKKRRDTRMMINK